MNFFHLLLPLDLKNGIPVDSKGNPIKSIGNVDETITIYRVVPEGVNTVNPNDWVFINQGQAEEALNNANKNSDGKFNLIEMEVSQGDVYPASKGGLEMGYTPKNTKIKTYEVSTKGDAFGKQFSALNATFKEGPYAGRTIEDVWQNEIKKSGKGKPPSKDSILFGSDIMESKLNIKNCGKCG